MKPRWTRKPPASVGRYFAASRSKPDPAAPYKICISEVFWSGPPRALHEIGLFSCALPLTAYKGRDVWWWTAPIEEPPPPVWPRKRATVRASSTPGETP